MNTTSCKSRTKSVVAGVGFAAATLPAILFSGTGTANAEAAVVPFSDALGVSVHVVSVGPSPSSGWCQYTAEPAFVPPGVLPPLPVYDVPFYLQANAVHKLWFPGIQTGTIWNVDVECEHGGDSFNIPVKY
ncbi:hypothetical protein CQY20_11065 [Mycolicibacterium agri]|uniref:Uncharacterized protein n=1 Tax=Mycolicibacterium agri TaxID=36811 RepID=A0A2A7N5U4_MYCAG|nr:hypothetical protein [Mycolicibacterium agri]PEG39097.1 hypothetical protein CQY20_11065 [Mycolicibacterium agri]GFG53988.1 hypothetical protein MAGR_54290 [Mycolicibacterium agri]